MYTSGLQQEHTMHIKWEVRQIKNVSSKHLRMCDKKQANTDIVEMLTLEFWCQGFKCTNKKTFYTTRLKKYILLHMVAEQCTVVLLEKN